MNIEQLFIGRRPQDLSEEEYKLYCRLIVRGTVKLDKRTGLIISD